MDLYQDHSHFPVNRFPEIYARLARHHPRLWALLFHASNRGERRLNETTLLRPWIETRLAALLDREQPGLVVSVLPVVNGLLAESTARLARPAV